MKKKLLPMIVIAVIFLLLLGGEQTFSYITAGKRVINKKMDESVPFFFEIERARGMVVDLDEALWKYQEMLVGIKVDMDYLKEEISSKEKDLAKKRQLLEQISASLKQKQDHYLINGKRYSYGEVSDDALTKAKIYKQKMGYLKAKRDNLKMMDETSVRLERQIVEAESKKHQFESTIETLEARHTNFEAKRELALLSDNDNIRDFQENHILRVREVLKNLEKRQDKAERLLDGLMDLKTKSGNIDYGEDTKDALEEIQAALSAGS